MNSCVGNTQNAIRGWLWVVGVTGGFFFPFFIFLLCFWKIHLTLTCPPAEHNACMDQHLLGVGWWGLRGQTRSPTRAAQVTCREKVTWSFLLRNPDSPWVKSHFHTAHCSQIQGQGTLSSIELIQFKTKIHVYVHSKASLKKK